MKAAVLEKIDKMVVKEVPVPVIDDDGVLVKVESCAVCGSDIRIFHHGNSRVKTPTIIGHEISGQVVETGKNVRKFKVGDRVAIGADVPCGECVFCEAGIGNNCQINYAMGYQYQGGFAQYLELNRTVVNFGPVHKIPDHVSYDEAALAEPLGCALNALELSAVRLGDTVVIIGAGPIGCMLIEVSKLMGATKVIVVQRSRPRLEMARQFGADVYICSSEEDAVARVLEETGGLGADVVITANPSPESQVEALKMAKNRARVNLFGGLPVSKQEVTLNTNIIHYKELFVHGAHGAMPQHHQKAIDLIASGRIDMKRYFTHKFPLAEIGRAFEAAESHVGMRVIVNPNR
ncbi:MAG: zinc-dependent dehydrogenase [Saccharofermentanales bacterium]